MRFLRKVAPVLALLIGTLGAAPEARAVPVELGLRGAFAISGFRGFDAVVKDEHKLGFAGGAYARVRLSSTLTLEPEVSFVTKGASLGESEGTDESGNPTGTFETLYAVDYLEIPVLIRVTPPGAAALRPSVAFGPVVAFELSEGFQNTGADRHHFDASHLESTDVGAALGLGVERTSGRLRWNAEARGTLGLVDLADAEALYGKVSNWDVRLALGVGFVPR